MVENGIEENIVLPYGVEIVRNLFLATQTTIPDIWRDDQEHAIELISNLADPLARIRFLWGEKTGLTQRETNLITRLPPPGVGISIADILIRLSRGQSPFEQAIWPDTITEYNCSKVEIGIINGEVSFEFDEGQLYNPFNANLLSRDPVLQSHFNRQLRLATQTPSLETVNLHLRQQYSDIGDPDQGREPIAASHKTVLWREGKKI